MRDAPQKAASILMNGPAVEIPIAAVAARAGEVDGRGHLEWR
jgi:hypothetical protein